MTDSNRMLTIYDVFNLYIKKSCTKGSATMSFPEFMATFDAINATVTITYIDSAANYYDEDFYTVNIREVDRFKINEFYYIHDVTIMNPKKEYFEFIEYKNNEKDELY